MRLIDADKLIEKLNLDNITFHYGDDYEMAEYVKENINQAPTVDTWHYPSKGEYPTNEGRVLCNLNGTGDWYECGGYDKDSKQWFYENFVAANDPICWQYIVPPKEESDDFSK